MATQLPGEDILASDIIVPKYVQKSGATVHTSTTAVVADPDITFPLAIGTYRVELFMYASSTNAAFTSDVRTDWDFTGTAAIQRSCIGPGPASVNTTGDSTTAGSGMSRATAHALGTDVIYGITDNASSVVHEDILVIVTVAGTMTLRTAQGTSSATSTTISAGTHCYITEIEAT